MHASKTMKSILFSTYYFLKLIFFSKKYDVVFVSSAFFNRGEGGENLLLKPMIEYCKHNNLKYMIFEDTDLKGAYKNFSRNQDSIPFDFISLIQILLRKFFYYKNKKSITKDEIYFRELKIAKILSSVFFKKFQSKIYITLLWNNVTLWRCISPSACVVDYQHGIIFNGHEESVKNGNPPRVKFANEIVTFVYGDTFKHILINNDETGFYNERTVKTIGINKDIFHPKKISVNNKKILFTLQIVPDFKDKEVNKIYIKIVESLIRSNSSFLSENNYEIIFRHHPRFNVGNTPNININYDFVSFDNKTPLVDLLEMVSIHITFHSTTTIEAAMMGIPTIFIDMHEQFSPNDIFLKQYKYPFDRFAIRANEDLKFFLIELGDKNKFNEKCVDIHKWSKKLYQDFDELSFRDFLLEKMNDEKNSSDRGAVKLKKQV